MSHPQLATGVKSRVRVAITFALAAGLMAGCASTHSAERDPGDRLEGYNRAIYAFNDGLDTVALEPAATAWTRVMPEPVRHATSRFFDNLLYLDTVLNSFLQGKVRQGFSDLARFGVNTTFGILGLFDVATPMGLKQNKEDFGQTLGVWGAGPGEYLVHPLIGPSSVRDTGGVIVSLLTNPIMYASAPVAVPLAVLGIIDMRARAEGFVRLREQAATDPYIFTRESYLQKREFDIHDGNPPPPRFDTATAPVEGARGSLPELSEVTPDIVLAAMASSPPVETANGLKPGLVGEASPAPAELGAPSGQPVLAAEALPRMVRTSSVLMGRYAEGIHCETCGKAF